MIEIEINDNGKRVREVKAQMSGLGDWYRHFAVALAQMEVENLNLNLMVFPPIWISYRMVLLALLPLGTLR